MLRIFLKLHFEVKTPVIDWMEHSDILWFIKKEIEIKKYNYLVFIPFHATSNILFNALAKNGVLTQIPTSYVG